MAELIIETTEGVRLRHEIAGAGSRAAAALVDLAVYGTLWLVLLVVIGSIAELDPTGAAGFFFGLLAGGTLLFAVLYQALFGVLGRGQTLGKRLLGIRVLDLQGIPATWVQHVLRGLFWPLEALLLIPLPVGLVLIAVTEKRQRLGDLVAGTIVLRDVTGWTPPDPYPRARWSQLTDRALPLVPALAERFDGQDLAFLRDLLGRRGLDDAARRKLLVQSALHYLDVLGLRREGEKPSARAAQGMLREIYLFLRETRGAYSSSR